MTYNRRKFLKQAALAAAVPFSYSQLISCASGSESSSTNSATLSDFSIDKYGIQLWTVKEQMSKDPAGTIKQLAAFGYNQIESFGGSSGIFWGMKPAEFAALLNENNLEAVGSHCNPEYTNNPNLADDFNQLCEDAAAVGMKYLTNPFPGPVASYDDWMKIAEGLNRQGEISKKHGLKTGYHNHHGEFITVGDNQLPYKLLLDNTDKSLVDFEMDIYWVVKAKQDPAKWLSEYSGRFKLCHIKDLHKVERITEIENTEEIEGDFWPHSTSCQIGTGQIDFDALLPIAKENGIEEFIVEQERFDNSDPLSDADKNAQFMNKYLPKS